MSNDLIGGVRYNRFTPSAQVCDYPYVAGNVNTTFSDQTNFVCVCFDLELNILWYITEKQFFDELNRHLTTNFDSSRGESSYNSCSHVVGFDPVRRCYYCLSSLYNSVDSDHWYLSRITMEGKIQYLKRFSYNISFWPYSNMFGGPFVVRDGRFSMGFSIISGVPQIFQGSVDDPDMSPLTVTDVSQFLGPSASIGFGYQTSLWDTDKCLWGSRINANAVSNSSQNSFYQFGYHDLTLQQYVPVYTNPQKIPGSDERYRYVLVAKSTETITRAAYIEILQRRENPNTSTFIPVESSLYTSTDFIGNGNMTFQKVADLPIWAGSYSLDNWENMEVHRDFVRINQNSSNTTAVYYRYDGAHFSPSYATVYQRPDFAWFPGFSIPYATTSNTPDYRSMPLDARDQNGEILHRLEDYNETRISGGTNTYKLVAQLAVMKQQRSPIFHSDTKIDSYGQIVFGATDANPMLVNGNAYGMKDNLPVKIM